MQVDLARLEEIFGEALAKADVAGRATFLDEACAGDARLRARVEALLAAHEAADKLLRLPSEQIADATSIHVTEGPGTTIGRYKLLEQIGEGGFGVVFMAEQQEPVHRRVALKIIKLGMDTRQVVARFEAERQALAMMDHPNIAKVLDAGATGTGRPFFVMELIRGSPITEYCDAGRLSVPQRLNLFIQVCQAVQHAHQKGIIHRDLKPTNVLVTVVDDRPVPKIIDFGVAKAIEGKLTDRTLFTGYHQLIGTPAYMSPEQAQLSGVDVDTRSDIYGLGVLLYELLTGTTPFDANQLLDMPFDEMQRIFREVEPPKPSTRLSTSNALPSISAQRQIEPAKLKKLVRGELDWIVMKCLEKDRSRRYESATGVADDIERYLNDQPINARPATRVYSLKKFVRRNKMIVLASFAVVAGLVTGLILATTGFIQASQQAQIAKTEGAKAIAISDLLRKTLESANPEQANGPDYTVRQLLDHFSQSFSAGLPDQPAVEAEIRTTIGRAYWRLGVTDEGEPQLRRALELRRREFGSDHERVADSLVDHAWCLCEQLRLPEAEAAAREALRIRRAGHTAGLPLIQSQLVLENILVFAGRYEEAQAVAEAALAQARTTGAEYPEVAVVLEILADTLNERGHFAEAEQTARQAMELHYRLHGPKHPETAWTLQILGRTLLNQGKLAESETALREALAIFRHDYRGHHHSLDSTSDYLKQVLTARGDQAGLEALERERLEAGNIEPQRPTDQKPTTNN